MRSIYVPIICVRRGWFLLRMYAASGLVFLFFQSYMVSTAGAEAGTPYCPVPFESSLQVLQTIPLSVASSSCEVLGSAWSGPVSPKTREAHPSHSESISLRSKSPANISGTVNTEKTLISIIAPSLPIPDVRMDTGIPPPLQGMQMVMNDHVQSQVDLFQTRLRERFGQWLSRSGQYLPMMQAILKKEKLPEELVYLALIESGFHPKAHSHAGAVGQWQFIKATAERYGLRVNKWIDERRDPVKSTMAAAEYLKDLYSMFQSWTLSMASYNAGEGRIMRAMADTKAQDFWELRNSDHIRDETKAYVPKFMAAAIIAKNPQQYGFFVDYESPVPYEEVVISVATPLKRIAKAAGVSVQEIQAFNPELKQETTPPAYPQYRLKLPWGSKKRFIDNFTPANIFEKAIKPIVKKKVMIKKNHKIVEKKKALKLKKARKYRVTKVEKITDPSNLPRTTAYLPECSESLTATSSRGCRSRS